MYDINISSLWCGVMATKVPDSCFVELYSQYSSLMRESNDRYTKHIDKEEYYAERHFHFIYLRSGRIEMDKPEQGFKI